MKNKALLHEISNLLEHISKALDAQRSTFFLINEESDTLESLVAQEVDRIVFSVPTHQGIAGACYRTQKVILENDVPGNRFFDPTYDKLLDFSTQSTLCFPVFDTPNTVAGVIQCINKEGGFTEQDTTILRGFSESIALLLKNTRLYHATALVKNNFSQLLDFLPSYSSFSGFQTYVGRNLRH